MLLSLEVVNGTLDNSFSKYVNMYTVTVDENENSLVFNYVVEEGYNVKILNNENFTYGSNMVYIEVYNELESNTYTIEVYKEKTTSASLVDTSASELEVNSYLEWYTPYLIGFICLLFIFIFFKILFFKRKKKIIKKQ